MSTIESRASEIQSQRGDGLVHAADLHNFISELFKPAARWVEGKGVMIANAGKKKK